VLHSVVADHRWLAAEATDARLVADIADGYDVVIMGADKWHQLHDPTFYGGPEAEPAAAMDRALERLPICAVAPRDGLTVPPEVELSVPRWVARQSSSDAVAGAPWMALSAARHSGLWWEIR